MSILIEGVEMPKTYPLTVTIYPDGQVLSETVGAKDVHGIAIATDMRPVGQGKWITHPRETWIGVDINGKETQPRQYFAYECPFCGFTTGAIGKSYNFCPNCGADMREES